MRIAYAFKIQADILNSPPNCKDLVKRTMEDRCNNTANLTQRRKSLWAHCNAPNPPVCKGQTKVFETQKREDQLCSQDSSLILWFHYKNKWPGKEDDGGGQMQQQITHDQKRNPRGHVVHSRSMLCAAKHIGVMNLIKWQSDIWGRSLVQARSVAYF